MTVSLPDNKWLTQFRKRLADWYDHQARALPWRETRDPYAIWVSEIMLQQTQVATVIEYYRRFLKSFPDVATLAAADEQNVLSHWSGLGYYRRAKQLHRAAQEICAEHEGIFPETFESVLALPGIGRYTAGAITSFAFEQRQPILEANTIRLHCRLLGLQDDATKASSQKLLWSFAELLLPRRPSRTSVSSINQAVMELGSLVCKPTKPACSTCPVSSLCVAYEQGTQHQIPHKKEKPTYEQQTHLLVAINRRGKWLLRQNQPGEWWAGLWDFPRTEIQSNPPSQSLNQSRDGQRAQRVMEEIHARLGLQCELTHGMKVFKHGVTKYKITLHGFYARPDLPFELPDGYQWCDLERAAELPLTSTSKKVLNHLRKTT